MKSLRIAVIGDGKMATDCLSEIAGRKSIGVCTYVYHRESPWPPKSTDLPSGARVVECDNVNESTVIEALKKDRPDLLVNANNFDILRGELLNVAPGAVINFHNGPLPAYRGMNIPTWAIFNGETKHGVTWHVVRESVDTGPILAYEEFDVDPGETALTLTFKCLAAGLRQFQCVLDNWISSGQLDGKPQVGKSRRYYAKQLPNDGFIDFSWPARDLSRFIRSMSMRPFRDLGIRMRFCDGDRVFYSESVELLDSGDDRLPPGTVLRRSDRGLTVATADAAVLISDLSDKAGHSIKVDDWSAVAGNMLSPAIDTDCSPR